MALFTEIIPTVRFGNVTVEADDFETLVQNSHLVRNSDYYKPLIAKGELELGSPGTGVSADLPAGLGMQTKLCPLCNAPMKQRKGKFGMFYGCSRYPECRGTRDESGKDTSKHV